MAQTVVERTTEICSQNRVYTEQEDREDIPVDSNQSVFVEITDSAEGPKRFSDFIVQLHLDGEFFVPKQSMEQLDLSVGDEVTYRIY